MDVEVEVAPAHGEDGGTAAAEPVMQRNPGVIYGLGNLVENAIDFASSKVDVRATWSDGEVSIEIVDDGEGFPPHVLEQLGEPFVTTRPGHGGDGEALDEHIGMGLGFFIAKTLLERSGARLELANRAQPPGGAVGDGGLAAGEVRAAPGAAERTPLPPRRRRLNQVRRRDAYAALHNRPGRHSSQSFPWLAINHHAIVA